MVCMVCFRYIIVNTLHKGDNKDNDDDDDDDVNNNNNFLINYTASQGPLLIDCRDLMKTLLILQHFTGDNVIVSACLFVFVGI